MAAVCGIAHPRRVCVAEKEAPPRTRPAAGSSWGDKAPWPVRGTRIGEARTRLLCACKDRRALEESVLAEVERAEEFLAQGVLQELVVAHRAEIEPKAIAKRSAELLRTG